MPEGGGSSPYTVEVSSAVGEKMVDDSQSTLLSAVAEMDIREEAGCSSIYGSASEDEEGGASPTSLSPSGKDGGSEGASASGQVVNHHKSHRTRGESSHEGPRKGGKGRQIVVRLHQKAIAIDGTSTKLKKVHTCGGSNDGESDTAGSLHHVDSVVGASSENGDDDDVASHPSGTHGHAPAGAVSTPAAPATSSSSSSPATSSSSSSSSSGGANGEGECRSGVQEDTGGLAASAVGSSDSSSSGSTHPHQPQLGGSGGNYHGGYQGMSAYQGGRGKAGNTRRPSLPARSVSYPPASSSTGHHHHHHSRQQQQQQHLHGPTGGQAWSYSPSYAGGGYGRGVSPAGYGPPPSGSSALMGGSGGAPPPPSYRGGPRAAGAAQQPPPPPAPQHHRYFQGGYGGPSPAPMPLPYHGAAANLASTAMGFYHTQQQLLPTPMGLTIRANLMKMNAQEAREYLAAMAVQQIEYYFSTDNLCRDTYLRAHLDEAGWVPLAFVCNFPTVASFAADYYEIIKTLRDSLILEYDEENETIRLKEGCARWLVPTPNGTMGVPRWLKQRPPGMDGSPDGPHPYHHPYQPQPTQQQQYHHQHHQLYSSTGPRGHHHNAAPSDPPPLTYKGGSSSNGHADSGGSKAGSGKKSTSPMGSGRQHHHHPRGSSSSSSYHHHNKYGYHNNHPDHRHHSEKDSASAAAGAKSAPPPKPAAALSSNDDQASTPAAGGTRKQDDNEVVMESASAAAAAAATESSTTSGKKKGGEGGKEKQHQQMGAAAATKELQVGS